MYAGRSLGVTVDLILSRLMAFGLFDELRNTGKRSSENYKESSDEPRGVSALRGVSLVYRANAV